MTRSQSRDLRPVRGSEIAGSWYPADPEALAREVDGYLDAAEPSVNADVSALIAPHAGLMYSGPVGAYAYRAVQGREYDVAVLIGPSHYVGFEGVSTYPRGSFATPFGQCPVDRGVATHLLEGSESVIDYPRAHVREHSVEMQLPFLCRVLPDTPIVPMVMGFQTRETIIGLAETLAATLQGMRALLVASTDLSHYFDAEHAARLDARVVELVNRFDWEGLMAELERYPEHERGRCVACGGGPAVAVMHAAQALGATKAAVLKRGDSSDVSGDTDHVVGYLAAAIV